MFRQSLITSAASTALAIAVFATAPLSADQVTGVKEINVDYDLTAFAGSNALDFYPDLTDDLTDAIAQTVPLAINEPGMRIEVNVKGISLNGDAMLPATREFNELGGVVGVFGPNDPSPIVSVPVAVAAYADASAVPAGTVPIAPAEGDFYNAMVMGFAMQVARLVPDMIDVRTGAEVSQ